MGIASTKEEQFLPLQKKNSISLSKESLYLKKKDSISLSKEDLEDSCCILLLGTGFSGKSTLFFQLSKIDIKKTNTIRLMEGYKPTIYYHTFMMAIDIGKFCESTNNFKNEKSKHLLKQLIDFEGDSIGTPKFYAKLKESEKNDEYPVIETLMELWKDKGMINNQFKLKDSVFYFDGFEWFCKMETLERLKSANYFPTDTDVLYIRKKTTGFRRILLESKTMKYELISGGGQQNERKKWKSNFKKADILLYVISLSDFDEKVWEDHSINRMKEALQAFEETVNQNEFSETPLIVIFNKEDLLSKKIQEKDTLKETFPEYTGGKDPVKALNFIQDMFLKNYKGNPENLHHFHCHLMNFENLQERLILLEEISNKLKKDGKIKKKEEE